MVYVVAAYSITLGALLVYGVLLQHRVRIARARRGEPAGAGFNLGAALLTPFWAWSRGLRVAAAALAAGLVALAFAHEAGLRLPALALISLLSGAALFFGFVGDRIAAAREAGADPAALARRELPWALAAAVLYSVVLPWACYFVLGSP